jgi:hypothetical protein
MRGDKESISDPDQTKNIKMLERNIDRMKKDFESMIKDLATDLTAAVGVPDDGPFKKVVDDFDDAVQTMRTALNNLSIKADDADDKLLPSAGETVTEDPPEADTDDTGDVDLPPFSNPWTKPGEEEMINENMLKLWEKIIK